ncbi:MAG TPA: hypothetical protein VM144_19200 [Aestuariivirga sp.]|nr:hypothetical protein [Aestuariivirga sp.]
MSREEELKRVPLKHTDMSKWPVGVRSIAIDETDAFGVDVNGILYWHGKPVEIKHPVTLSKTQSVLAGGAAVSAIVIGVIELGKVIVWAIG